MVTCKDLISLWLLSKWEQERMVGGHLSREGCPQTQM